MHPYRISSTVCHQFNLIKYEKAPICETKRKGHQCESSRLFCSQEPMIINHWPGKRRQEAVSIRGKRLLCYYFLYPYLFYLDFRFFIISSNPYSWASAVCVRRALINLYCAHKKMLMVFVLKANLPCHFLLYKWNVTFGKRIFWLNSCL